MKCARLLVYGMLVLPAAADGPAFILTQDRPQIQSPAIQEASGLAASPQDTRLLWAINDSGGTADLHLFNTTGTARGHVNISNANNIDWEDLASFTLDGKSWLLIADTGDNRAARKSVTLHIIAEPKLPTDGQNLATSTTASWRIDFTYEGGPRDCESVAVDPIREKIILVSKRTKPPEVYELPLRPTEKSGTIVAKKIGNLLTESPVRNLIPFSNQPVGIDISADASFAAIATYYGVFLFPRAPMESWATAFSRKPKPLAPHGLAQAESLAISKDGQSIFVVSEGKKSPIARYHTTP